jgi:4-amino-4-deoxy-L-arabinose transferase-like glycosyltransferase
MITEGRPRVDATRGRGLAGAPLLALGALTVLALGLRIVGIDQTLYADENFTYRIVIQGSLAGVISDVYHTSITPPLHYVLAWLPLRFGGDKPVLIRLPSLILGTAFVPLIFVLGRRIAGVGTGLLAALVVAISPFAIWYSDEARAYMLMMFLVALSTLAMLKSVNGGGRRWWVVYAVSACAALYSHYTAVFVIVAQGLWALWVHRERWRELLIVNAAVVVAYLPWIPGFLEQRKNDVGIDIIDSFSPPLTPGLMVTLPLRTLIGHPYFALSDFPGPKAWLLAAVIVVLATVAAVRHRVVLEGLASSRSSIGRLLRSEPALLVILTVATPLGLLVYKATGSSLFIPRNLSASLPALTILAALVVARLAAAVPRWLGAAGVGVIVAVLAITSAQSFETKYRRPAYREAARYLDRVAAPREPVVQALLFRVRRLPPTDLDIYFRRPHPLYAREPNVPKLLRAGRKVYTVGPNWLLGKRPILRPGERAPAGLLARLQQTSGPNGLVDTTNAKTFAGIVPITVVTYGGLVDGQLERRGRQEVISWSRGRRVLVTPGATRGQVQLALPYGRSLAFGGWAVDPARRRPVDWFLIFQGDRLIARAAGGGRRDDIARLYGRTAVLTGFGVPVSPPPVGRREPVRVFAVVGDRASELPLAPAVRRALRQPPAGG